MLLNLNLHSNLLEQFEKKAKPPKFINWQPVSEFLSQIGLDDQTINSLGTANLNIPGVRSLFNPIYFRFPNLIHMY